MRESFAKKLPTNHSEIQLLNNNEANIAEKQLIH